MSEKAIAAGTLALEARAWAAVPAVPADLLDDVPGLSPGPPALLPVVIEIVAPFGPPRPDKGKSARACGL